MQVIGLCRFSYPAIGGFQIEHDSIEDRIAFLYDPKRMEERFALFEAIALPGLQGQTDGDFEFIIVIGDSLPAQYRDQLHDLTAGMRQVRIEAHPPRRQRNVMQDILNTARADMDAPCLQFRHDDDDAVGVDFVEKLRAAQQDADGLCRRNPLVAFDWPQGYVATADRTGIQAALIHRPFLAVGLAMYVAGGETRSMMNFAHQRIGHNMPSVSFGQNPMWVRTHNGFNDSRQKKNVRQFDLAPLSKDEERRFQRLFAIDATHVRRVFSI